MKPPSRRRRMNDEPHHPSRPVGACVPRHPGAGARGPAGLPRAGADRRGDQRRPLEGAGRGRRHAPRHLRVLPINEKWHIAANGDIGGFGVESDFTWSVTSVLGYDFSLFDHPASVYLGYRAIGWDFTERSGSNRFTWDVVMHGPIMGFSLLF